MQEVKFSISFCRCAIKAAVAHELHAFNNNTNAQKYHGFLTKQHPNLENVEYQLLRKLCLQYSQPLPVHHPQHEQASGKVEVAKQQGAACDTVGASNEAELANQEAKNTVLDSETKAETGVPKAGDPDFSITLAAGTTAPSESSKGTEHPARDASDTVGESVKRNASSPDIEGSNGPAQKLKRLKEACEEEKAEPGTVEVYVDALFESDEDPPASGGENVPGSGEYAPESAACEGQLVSAERSREQQGASAASDVWTEVREFVAMCLEPWKVSGAVDDEQAEVIMDKCVSKVLGAHAGRKDTAFLNAEGERIQGLVAQYADFIIQKSQKKK